MKDDDIVNEFYAQIKTIKSQIKHDFHPIQMIITKFDTHLWDAYSYHLSHFRSSNAYLLAR